MSRRAVRLHIKRILNLRPEHSGANLMDTERAAELGFLRELETSQQAVAFDGVVLDYLAIDLAIKLHGSGMSESEISLLTGPYTVVVDRKGDLVSWYVWRHSRRQTVRHGARAINGVSYADAMCAAFPFR